MQKTKESEAGVSSPSTRLFRTGPVRVNIGAGLSPREGYVNCDLHAGPGIDHAFDCQERWPFPDESVSEVYSSHVLEHLPNPLAFFEQAWRVLIPNGQMVIRVPYGWHSAAWWDLTHLRPWMQESFACVQPGFSHFSRNNQEKDFGYAYWVQSVVMVLNVPFARLWRWRLLRKPVMFALNHMIGVVRELVATLTKTTPNDPASIAFGGKKHPAFVYTQLGAWEHEMKGRELKPGEPPVMIVYWSETHREAVAGF